MSPRIVYCYSSKAVFAENEPCEFDYGAKGVEKEYEVVRYAAGKYKWGYYPFRMLENFLCKRARMGVKFQWFLNHKGRLKEDDVLFATSDAVALGILSFKARGQVKNPVVMYAQALADRFRYFGEKRWMVELYTRWLQQADLILAFSERERLEFLRCFDVDPKRVKTIHFGVDRSFWETNEKSAGDYILGVGHDSNRDYEFLIANYEMDIPLKIVTKKPINASHELLELKKNIPFQELKELYQNARCVVVPLRACEQSAGFSVTLQALACGTPVLIAGTEPMKSIFSDCEQVVFYEPGDPDSLKKNLQMVCGDEVLREKLWSKGLEVIASHFNYERFSGELLEIFSDLDGNARKHPSTSLGG